MVPEQRHILLLWLNIYDAITLGIRRSIAVRCRECTLPETGFKPRMGYVQRYRSCSFNHEHDLCTYPMVAGARGGTIQRAGADTNLANIFVTHMRVYPTLCVIIRTASNDAEMR